MFDLDTFLKQHCRAANAIAVVTVDADGNLTGLRFIKNETATNSKEEEEELRKLRERVTSLEADNARLRAEVFDLLIKRPVQHPYPRHPSPWERPYKWERTTSPFDQIPMPHLTSDKTSR